MRSGPASVRKGFWRSPAAPLPWGGDRDCTPPVVAPQGGVLPHRWRADVRSRWPSPPAPHRALHLAFGLALADRLALVVDVLAAGEGDLDLGVWALEVHARRHDGETAFADPAGEAIDLLAVQQQLARAIRLVVLARGGLVVRDVQVVQPQLAVGRERRVAVAHLGAVGAQRLDLGPAQ